LLTVHIPQDTVYGTHNRTHDLVNEIRVFIQQALKAGTIQPQQLTITHRTQAGGVLYTVKEAQFTEDIALAKNLQTNQLTAPGFCYDLHVSAAQDMQAIILLPLLDQEGTVLDSTVRHDTRKQFAL
jgi:hypothetical protein